ncbi:bifunctional nuclease domain-containing protein [Xylanibacter caecicola]|uniref:bifunctional nuclease domain-containing protein n=1 Tax=Xylanibacter caecicola TaxID=2736294 RepID=UPI0025842EB3|nr:bifunctional nuclease domain-containing protein [Xylanibacter caecicola]
MSRIRLVFKGVSEIVGTDDLGVLVLTDEKEQRQITVVCDKAMAVQAELRVHRVPITQIMLPEVLSKVIANQTELQLEILISGIDDGQYRVMLYNKDTLEPTLIRAGDAVLLSMAGNIPIYIDHDLMMRQSVPYREDSRGVSLPVNTISDEMLQAALDKAVEDENYELASHLRDEQLRRGKK